MTRTSGTAARATYTASITLPRGASRGTYYVHVFAWDRDHNEENHVSSSNPGGWSGATFLHTDPTIIVGPEG
jgi:hypothetical protein